MMNDQQFFEPIKTWREQAEALFFVEHLKINDIAATVKKSRETVSRHICACKGYEEEISERRRQSAKRRKEYKRSWDRENRSGRFRTVCAESMKQEHITAVRILSRERHFK